MKELEEFKKSILNTIDNNSTIIINAFNKVAKYFFPPQISILLFVAHPQISDLSIEMVPMNDDYSVIGSSEFIIENLPYIIKTDIYKKEIYKKNLSQFEKTFEETVIKWMDNCYNNSDLSKINIQVLFYFTE